jgi:hypothetical protein
MTPFTEHPCRQGLSYFGHWIFATGIAIRLLASVAAFALHAILPFITIEPRLDLEATAAFLAERNRFITIAAARPRRQRSAAVWDTIVRRHDTPAWNASADRPISP